MGWRPPVARSVGREPFVGWPGAANSFFSASRLGTGGWDGRQRGGAGLFASPGGGPRGRHTAAPCMLGVGKGSTLRSGWVPWRVAALGRPQWPRQIGAAAALGKLSLVTGGGGRRWGWEGRGRRPPPALAFFLPPPPPQRPCRRRPARAGTASATSPAACGRPSPWRLLHSLPAGAGGKKGLRRRPPGWRCPSPAAVGGRLVPQPLPQSTPLVPPALPCEHRTLTRRGRLTPHPPTRAASLPGPLQSKGGPGPHGRSAAPPGPTPTSPARGLAPTE